MLYFIIVILIITIALFVYSGFRTKSKLEKIANGVLTKQDLKEIEAISKYYEISLIEAAKIHYGKAIITEEMIKRLERPYRELYEQCKNFPTNKQEKISNYLSSNSQDNYLEAINFILIAEGSYFSMQIMHRGDELSEALYNTYFLKDDESIDMYYPPNFYGDTSSFDIVEPRFFNNREYSKIANLLIASI